MDTEISISVIERGDRSLGENSRHNRTFGQHDDFSQFKEAAVSQLEDPQPVCDVVGTLRQD